MNASSIRLELVIVPTAVQFPAVAHDTDLNSTSGNKLLWTPSAKTAGRASSHTPFVDVMVNASWEPTLFLNLPTAVQFPGDAHDTEEKIESGLSFWTPSAKAAGCASSHTPFVDVMVNTSSRLLLFSNLPTAVQFPAVAHETAVNVALAGSFWIPSANSAGCASAHALFVDVMVNASRDPSELLNSPTAVQFPGDAHDTEAKLVSGELL